MKSRSLRPVLLLLCAVTPLAAAACGGKTTDSGTKKAEVSVTAAADLGKLLPADVRSRGELSIATDASYAPVEFSTNGGSTLQGLDIDLGNAIGKLLGVKAKFANTKFDGIVAGVAAKKYDLAMSALTDTKKRESQGVDFVNYFKAGTSIAVKKGNPLKISGEMDLCGVKVAAEQGTVQLTDLQDAEIDGAKTLKTKCTEAGKKAPEPVPLPDQNSVNSALLSGRADAFTADSPVVGYQIKVTNGQLQEAGQATAVAPYGIAMPQNSPLRGAVQQAVQKLIDDGTYTKILETWGVTNGAVTKASVNGAAE